MENTPHAKSPRLEKLEAELKEWGLDLDKFVSRARQAAADPRIGKLKNAGAEGAKEMEKGLETAWADLKEAFNSAASKFKQGSGKP